MPRKINPVRNGRVFLMLKINFYHKQERDEKQKSNQNAVTARIKYFVKCGVLPVYKYCHNYKNNYKNRCENQLAL